MARKKKDAGQVIIDGAEALFREGELPKQPNRFAKEAFDIYNEVAAMVGWPVTANLTEARQKKLLVAIHDCGSVRGWREAMERAGKSGLLTGKRKSLRYPVGFMAKLDFFLRTDKRTMLLDGEYDDKAVARTAMQQIRALPTPGARPIEKPFVPESQDVRELAMIESYTRHGRYADANRIAQARADRLGIPAVLIPDPAVAMEGMAPKPAPSPRNRPTVTDIPDWADEPIPSYAEVPE